MAGSIGRTQGARVETTPARNASPRVAIAKVSDALLQEPANGFLACISDQPADLVGALEDNQRAPFRCLEASHHVLLRVVVDGVDGIDAERLFALQLVEDLALRMADHAPGRRNVDEDCLS